MAQQKSFRRIAANIAKLPELSRRPNYCEPKAGNVIVMRKPS
jgi:hypothetical protein